MVAAGITLGVVIAAVARGVAAGGIGIFTAGLGNTGLEAAVAMCDSDSCCVTAA